MLYEILQIALFFALILVCAKPLGAFMANVFEGQRTFLHPVLRWLEVLTYKVIGVKEEVEQRWTQYTAALLSFSIFGFLLVYLMQRAQGYLPFNPQHFARRQRAAGPGVQHRDQLRDQHQLAGLFGRIDIELFRADGGADGAEFCLGGGRASRSRSRWSAASPGRKRRRIGNFWVDVTRGNVLCAVADVDRRRALFLCSQGVIQNLNPYTTVTTVEGAKQIIAQGPVASQEAIKQLGTNGGGFFNANSAHPFENPTPLSNLVRRCC